MGQCSILSSAFSRWDPKKNPGLFLQEFLIQGETSKDQGQRFCFQLKGKWCQFRHAVKNEQNQTFKW